jgi:hypothetical protein
MMPRMREIRFRHKKLDCIRQLLPRDQIFVFLACKNFPQPLTLALKFGGIGPL